MKQREGHFVHLAEETAVLKDQVDALRELSVMTLKNDNSIVDNGYSHDRRMSDKEAKAHAAAGKCNDDNKSLNNMIDIFKFNGQNILLSFLSLLFETSRSKCGTLCCYNGQLLRKLHATITSCPITYVNPK